MNIIAKHVTNRPLAIDKKMIIQLKLIFICLIFCYSLVIVQLYKRTNINDIYICLSKNQNQSWTLYFYESLAVTLMLHIASLPRIHPRCYLLNYLRLINHNLAPCFFFFDICFIFWIIFK